MFPPRKSFVKKSFVLVVAVAARYEISELRTRFASIRFVERPREPARPRPATVLMV